jgi:hypothetical protein
MLGVVLFFKTETAKTVTMLCTVFLYDSHFGFWGNPRSVEKNRMGKKQRRVKTL